MNSNKIKHILQLIEKGNLTANDALMELEGDSPDSRLRIPRKVDKKLLWNSNTSELRKRVLTLMNDLGTEEEKEFSMPNLAKRVLSRPPRKQSAFSSSTTSTTSQNMMPVHVPLEPPPPMYNPPSRELFVNPPSARDSIPKKKLSKNKRRKLNRKKRERKENEEKEVEEKQQIVSNPIKKPDPIGIRTADFWDFTASDFFRRRVFEKDSKWKVILIRDENRQPAPTHWLPSNTMDRFNEKIITLQFEGSDVFPAQLSSINCHPNAAGQYERLILVVDSPEAALQLLNMGITSSIVVLVGKCGSQMLDVTSGAFLSPFCSLLYYSHI